jgi:hypothetical protein
MTFALYTGRASSFCLDTKGSKKSRKERKLSRRSFHPSARTDVTYFEVEVSAFISAAVFLQTGLAVAILCD